MAVRTRHLLLFGMLLGLISGWADAALATREATPQRTAPQVEPQLRPQTVKLLRRLDNHVILQGVGLPVDAPIQVGEDIEIVEVKARSGTRIYLILRTDLDAPVGRRRVSIPGVRTDGVFIDIAPLTEAQQRMRAAEATGQTDAERARQPGPAASTRQPAVQAEVGEAASAQTSGTITRVAPSRRTENGEVDTGTTERLAPDGPDDVAAVRPDQRAPSATVRLPAVQDQAETAGPDRSPGNVARAAPTTRGEGEDMQTGSDAPLTPDTSPEAAASDRGVGRMPQAGQRVSEQDTIADVVSAPLTASSGAAGPTDAMIGPDAVDQSGLALLPTGATLVWISDNCPHSGSCPSTNDVFIEPKEIHEPVLFEWDASAVQGASAVSWQVVSGDFEPFSLTTALEPAGQSAGQIADGAAGQFQISVAQLLSLSATAGAIPTGEALAEAQLQTLVPSGVAPAPGTDVTSQVSGLAAAPQTFAVRVVPLKSTAQQIVVGKPSNTIHLVHGVIPSETVQIPGVSVEPAPKLAVSRFEWKKGYFSKYWPPGCSLDPPKPSDLEKTVAFFGDAVDWASQAYKDAKAAVVDGVVSAVAAIPPGIEIPPSWVAVALDGALTAVGLPPDIPNLDQLMNAGADYLAAELVNQLPVPPQVTEGLVEQAAIDAAVAKFKADAQASAKQAILNGAQAAADSMKVGPEAKCFGKWFRPYILLTVRNVGSAAVSQWRAQIWDDAYLFKGWMVGDIPLASGQETTIPLYPLSVSAMKISEKMSTQLGSYDSAKNADEWWDRFRSTNFSFLVGAPTQYMCYQGQASCSVSGNQVLYKTPTLRWYDNYTKDFVGP